MAELAVEGAGADGAEAGHHMGLEAAGNARHRGLQPGLAGIDREHAEGVGRQQLDRRVAGSELVGVFSQGVGNHQSGIANAEFENGKRAALTHQLVQAHQIGDIGLDSQAVAIRSAGGALRHQFRQPLGFEIFRRSVERDVVFKYAVHRQNSSTPTVSEW